MEVDSLSDPPMVTYAVKCKVMLFFSARDVI